MVNFTLSINKKNTRFKIKGRNNTLSISSNDDENVVSQKVKKCAAIAIVNELFK